MRSGFALCALALSALLSLTSCGGGQPRVLESITVDGVSSLSGTTFTATGHYSSAPTTVNNIQVAWFQTGPVIDPVQTWDFTLSAKPFSSACAGIPVSAQFYVIAYAPQNPTAPAQESMPFSVFETLVEQHSATQQDGFVAGSVTVTCSAAELQPRNPSPSAGF